MGGSVTGGSEGASPSKYEERSDYIKRAEKKLLEQQPPASTNQAVNRVAGEVFTESTNAAESSLNIEKLKEIIARDPQTDLVDGIPKDDQNLLKKVFNRTPKE